MKIVFYNITDAQPAVEAGPFASLSLHTDRIWAAGDIVAVYNQKRRTWTYRKTGQEFDSLRFEQ